MSTPSGKKVVIAAIVLAAAYAAIIVGGEMPGIRAALGKISISLLLGLFSLTLANNMLRFVKWDLFLRDAGVRINFVDCALVFFSGFSLLLTPGKVGGEAIKIYLLKKEKNVDAAKTLAVAVIDRAADVLGLAFVGMAALMFFGKDYGILPFAGAILLPAAAVLVLKNRGLQHIALSLPLLRKSKFLKKAMLQFSMFSAKTLLLSTAIAAIAWSLEAFALYYLLTSFGIASVFSSAAFVFSSSMLFGNMTMIPGGVGAVEAGLALLVNEFFSAGLGMAATVAVIFRITSFWAINVVGFAALAIFYRRSERK